MKLLRHIALLLLLTQLGQPLAICAENDSGSSQRFLQTHAGVYQTLRAKVIASYGKPAGFFILVSDKPIPLQSFDIQQIKPDEVQSVFVEYSIEDDRYVALHVNDNIYKLIGNVTFTINDVRIGIDNMNAYLSLTLGSGLIGFRGLERVIDSSGALSVVAEANEYGDYYDIAPYVLKEGKLLLRGKEVSSNSRIGLLLEQQKNPCLNEDVLFLTQEKIDQIKVAAQSKRATLLQEALVKNNSKIFLSKSLPLRVQSDFLVALDYLEGLIYEVTPIKSLFAGRHLCVVKTMDLGD